MLETKKRSIVKSITFRTIATISTIIIIYLLTGSLELAGIVGVLDVVSKLIIYYFHERAWGKISWGTRENQ